ncbi:hypothetical protein GOP47_0018306, partial [Adiantum capillus-veneris]
GSVPVVVFDGIDGFDDCGIATRVHDKQKVRCLDSQPVRFCPAGHELQLFPQLRLICIAKRGRRGLLLAAAELQLVELNKGSDESERAHRGGVDEIHKALHQERPPCSFRTLNEAQPFGARPC